jgi:ABC-type lipoprotein release transport system permease subunit
MVFFMVLRNIARNKKNSAIVALLIAVIAFLFFIGNSLIGRSNQGIQQAFVYSLTGDVVLEKKGGVTMNLFGANTPIIDDYFVIPTLPAYDAVMRIVSGENGIAGITSQVSGKAVLDFMGVREPVLLCGADAASYFTLFSGINLEQGRFLQAGEYGAMITADRANRIEQKSGQYPQMGTPLLLTSGGTAGFKIREVPLVGIFNYQNPGQFMNEIVITDPQTVRVLNSIQVASSADVALSDDKTSLLAANPDDLFGEIFSVSQDNGEEMFSADFLESYLSETRENENVDIKGGDWHFIIIRLKEGVSSSAFIASINKKIESYDVTAVDWRIAAGISAVLLLFIQALFNTGIFLVCVAGIITAINILLISVFRRTREIGTLRAIGASDTYIGSMVLLENIVLAVIAGATGIVGGFLFMRWVNNLSITISNELLISLLGGNVLTLEFLPGIAGLSFVLAVVLGFIASLYPIHTTIRIEPMAALRQG